MVMYMAKHHEQTDDDKVEILKQRREEIQEDSTADNTLR